MLTVACVKAGTKYGAEYVNNLAAMIGRHLTIPHRFVCFTEAPLGIDRRIEIRPLRDDLEGWWHKMALFQPGQFSIGDPILFFDLDTVISRNIDDLAKPVEFAILRDAYRPQGVQSSVMAWRAGVADAIWLDWETDERPLLAGGDQAYIEIVLHRQYGRKLPDSLILQNRYPGMFASYKAEHDRVRDAAVIVFHGEPKPHNCNDQFIASHWKREVTRSAA